MSLTDDLALVTACRDAPHLDRRLTPLVDCTLAALSLIEDTLRYHKGCGDWCPDNPRHRAALHTIATALGVATSTEIIPTDLGGL